MGTFRLFSVAVLLTVAACGSSSSGAGSDLATPDTEGRDTSSTDASVDVAADPAPEAQDNPTGDATFDATDDAPQGKDVSPEDLHFVEVGDPGFGTGVACDPPCESGMACLEGRCVAGSLFVAEPTPGALVGAWLSVDGARTDFGVQRTAPLNYEAWFRLSGNPPIILQTGLLLSDASPIASSRATVQWLGQEIDGHGPLDEFTMPALQQLAASNLADALAYVPLELGCLPPDEVDPALVAALLVPWQMLLKYVHTDRVERVEALATRVSCTYGLGVPKEDFRSAVRTLSLSRESPVPTVFGFFPFDGIGAATSMGPLLAWQGKLYGPCGALCRGTCGPDCPDVNCVVSEAYECLQKETPKENNGFKILRRFLQCGSAQGCRDHDDCYDLCNGAHGCGTWDAAYCRRDCDIEACNTWGYETCTHWAQGAGPQEDERVEYTYPVPGAQAEHDQDTCPDPVQEEMGSCCISFVQGTTPQTYCVEVPRKHCEREYLEQNIAVEEPYDQVGYPEFQVGSVCHAECTPRCPTFCWAIPPASPR